MEGKKPRISRENKKPYESQREEEGGGERNQFKVAKTLRKLAAKEKRTGHRRWGGQIVGGSTQRIKREGGELQNSGIRPREPLR